MIDKLLDGLSKALYESLTDFNGIDKLVLCISLLFFAFGVAIAIYMYKEVKKANEKTMTIMERHEKAQQENAREYKELNKAGIVVIEKLNTTMNEHSKLLDKNNYLLDVIFQKVI